jgi:hypothetical protein
MVGTTLSAILCFYDVHGKELAIKSSDNHSLEIMSLYQLLFCFSLMSVILSIFVWVIFSLERKAGRISLVNFSYVRLNFYCNDVTKTLGGFFSIY